MVRVSAMARVVFPDPFKPFTIVTTVIEFKGGFIDPLSNIPNDQLVNTTKHQIHRPFLIRYSSIV